MAMACSLSRFPRRLCGALLATLLLAAPLQARASFYPPFTGAVTVGVPAFVTMVVPLELTSAMLASLPPATVLFTTNDGPTKIALGLVSASFADGVITAGELLAAFPNAKFTVHGFTATLTGDARFTLNASACAPPAPLGTTCAALANFSGALPAGVANLNLQGSALGVTLSGAGALDALLNAILPSFLSTFSQFLQFDVQVTVLKGSQAIVFGAAPSINVGTTGTVSATGGPSGNPVTFTSNTPATCSVSGATVSGLGAGNCTIAANQAGNANYNAATTATQTFAIGKGSQAITFAAAPSIVVGATGTVSATGGASGNPVTFSSTTPTFCTVAGATVTGLAAGTCTIAASQASTANYNAATTVTQNLTIGKGSQAITFGTAPTIVVGLTGTVSAAGGASGNPVTFSSTTPTFCSVSGSLVTALAAGTCIIAASQAGNANYNAAPQVTRNVTITSVSSAVIDLSVAQAAAPNPVSAGKDFTLTLTVSNAGPGTASSVVLTDTLPAGSAFIWASPGCVHATGTVTCAVGTIANGASTVLQIVARRASAGTVTNTATASGAPSESNYTNNATSSPITVTAAPVATAIFRYRLYSDVTKEHHFTTDLNEYNTLGTYVGTWVQEGTVGKVLDGPGVFNGVTAVPYYRLYDTSTRWHHWTTDANEYYTLIQYPHWNGEGIDGYILPTNAPGTTELYRLNYPYLGSLHHWTIDVNEYNTLINSFGWVGEGGSGFVVQ